MKAVILAAGMGTRLAAAAAGLPKCMVPVAGRPIVDRMIERIAEAGIGELVVVTGYQAARLEAHLAASSHPLARAATCVFNERFAEWGNFYSKLVAERAVGDDGFLALDGDVVMDGDLLPRLLAAPGPIALAVERRADLGDEEMKVRVDADGRAVELNKRMAPADALGEFLGVERVDAEMAGQVFAALRSLIDRGETGEYYERAYELLMQRGVPFRIADITGCRWTEIDDAADLAYATELVATMS
jgi:L-glutamine-phosphate cytidylyltransferase